MNQEHKYQNGKNQNYKTQKRKDQKQNTSSTKKTSRQIVAMAGVVLLVALYLVTLLAAFIDRTASGRLFWVCLFATIAIPLLIWVYTWMYGKLTGRSTIADFQPGPDESRDSRDPQDPQDP